jgi:hypothetical protein
MVKLEIHDARVEGIAADGLLLPVDGLLCRLGGATASALRAALQPDDRADEMEYVEEELARLRPLHHPAAAVVDGVARWSKLVVSAAYPHDVNNVVHAPQDCARMIRQALPVAIALAHEHEIPALAATLIGTAYRMPVDLAARAFVDGLAAARAAVIVRWSIPEPAYRETALAAARRVGLIA